MKINGKHVLIAIAACAAIVLAAVYSRQIAQLLAPVAELGAGIYLRMF